MNNKRKRSVSLSLYQPMDSKRQAVVDAIASLDNKAKVSFRIKELRSKLAKCFAECQELFVILDTNKNRAVSMEEWLRFSLPDSFDINFESKKKENTFKQLPLRKPSYISKVPNESLKIRKRRNKRPSYMIAIEEKEKKSQIHYSQGMVMKQMLIDDFKSIDINNNGDIDQFEWWIFYMTNELSIYWPQKEKAYRITTFLNILKIIGPAVELTTEWLQLKVLSKKVKSKKKYYILWWFFYQHFAGKVSNASLFGKKSVSKLEVLSWFIALDFDPFQQQQIKRASSNLLVPITDTTEVSAKEQALRQRTKSQL